MRSVRNALSLFWILFLVFGLHAQNIPPELQRQYERYLSREHFQPESGEIPGYKTPDIYEETDSFLFEQKEGERLEITEERKEEVTFYEFIVVEGDTVQKILKAAPMELEFFGADFFEGTADLPRTGAPVAGSYKLRQGDNLLVNLWGSVDYEYNLTIDREGKVFIPKAGTLALSGYTLDRASELIQATLSRIYSDFEVDVTLAKIRGITVFVVGEVNAPGVYSLSGLGHVIDALVAATGPNEFGSYRNITVYRNARPVAKFDLYDFILDGATSGNIQLANGDVVSIPRLGSTVKIRGKVRRPAIYEIEDSTTLAGVIELAGGVLPDAHTGAVMVDRIEDGLHKVVTFDLADSIKAHKLACSGDDFSIFSIDKYRTNLVFLEGQVVQAGAFELEDSMRVSDLLMGGDQLLPDAYKERADLIRMLADRIREIIPVDLELALAGRGEAEDLILRSEDLLVIYSIWDVEERDVISIYGAVRRPGEFELFRNMRVSDLVFESGGLIESAFREKAELARINPGEPAEVVEIDLIEAVTNPGGPKDILLQPYDILFIRDIPGWKLQDIVTIDGEVRFPGKYALIQQNERLSHLIERAGGFTPEAFLNGAVFLRPKLTVDIEGRNLHYVVQQTQEAILDSVGKIVPAPYLFRYDPEQLARIIIDMDRVVKGVPEDDIILENEDSIYVPKIPTGVTIVGMVASNGTIHWLPGKRVNYYIQRAGGFTRNADTGGIRLVKANGKVVKVSLRSSGVEPGDAIIVPQQLKRKTDWMSIVNQTVSVLSGLATTLYIILKL